MTPYSAAEEALRELGVTEPKDIDIEAIAWCLGARVKYRPLDGCEARIAGNGDQAIITVNSRSSWRRKRYSVAHELGTGNITGDEFLFAGPTRSAVPVTTIRQPNE